MACLLLKQGQCMKPAAIAAAPAEVRIAINTRTDRIPDPAPVPIETTEANQGFARLARLLPLHRYPKIHEEEAHDK
ncbi:MAG: hypothetical protein V7642_1164 [Burkholderiales bacterium]